MKKNGIKLMCGVLCLTTVATGASLMASNIASAEVIPEKTKKFVGEPIDSLYNTYTVVKGDSLARISQKISLYLGVESTSKYWKVLAFLNDSSDLLHVGDVIRYPRTIEELDDLAADLKEAEWTFKTTIKNNSEEYAPYTKKIKTTTVYEVIKAACRGKYTVDRKFAKLYLQMQVVPAGWTLDTKISTTDEVHMLTEWIPSKEDILLFLISNGRYDEYDYYSEIWNRKIK